jgi:hypothetical protein
MPSVRILTIATMALALGCTVRERRPDGPYRLAEEFVDALSDEAVACTRELAPKITGEIVVVAELTPADKPPVIHDGGSAPGTDAVIACVRQRAADKLRTPPSAPAPFAKVRLPLPLVTSEIKYAFVQELPGSHAAP